MRSRTHEVQSRRFRPVLDGLESRQLLSGVKARRAAVIHALRVTPTHASTIAQLPTAPSLTATTVPANGDVNPYGVAFVPVGIARGGVLHAGDVLVSNFNNSGNLQGTGTTIVRITPGGQTSVFYQGPPGVGFSTALSVLKGGYVLVGTVPSTDGTSATVGQGSLMVLDKNGNVVANFADPNLLNGPWDMTVHDAGSHAQVFVSNVLSGTVSRFDVRLTGAERIPGDVSATQIASGYTFHGDPAAIFEVGPTGLAFNSGTNTLYVASTGDNAIYAVRNAATTKRRQRPRPHRLSG